jgi:hypothetical protein
VRIVPVKNKDTILARTGRWTKTIEMLNIAKGQVTVGKASGRAYEEYIIVKLVLEIPI